MALELEVLKSSGKSFGTISVTNSTTVLDLKKEIFRNFKVQVARQSIRNGPKGKDEKDDQLVKNITLEVPNKIYLKDLGPQIGWNTVFFIEYAGPLVVYGMLFFLPQCFYSNASLTAAKGQDSSTLFPFSIFPTDKINQVCRSNVPVKIQVNAYYAWILWSIHYMKRILETAFVHRFSHGTMPLFNLFKNSGYYWGFALYVAYHVNHPLHTPPPAWIFYVGITTFFFCEFGNLSIHILLRNLRPPGTNIRKIPVPDSNIFTYLFHFVSCPNYTYEFGSWVGFGLLTGCLPVFIFAFAGLYQMSVWAVGKHKKYCSEFPDYPKKRKAIIPFIL